MNRKIIKNLIELSISVEEADKIINENYDFNCIGEKIAFLKGMFDVELISKHDAIGTTEEESQEITYWAILATIINSSK